MGFEVKKVTDEKGLRELYALRYKVYCLEWSFEKPGKYPDGFESDIFDKHAVHFAVRDYKDKLAGTIRLILHSSEGFPMERYCELDIDKNELNMESLAEISRLVISKDYRRRAEDKYIFGPAEERRSVGSFRNMNTAYRRRAHDRYKKGMVSKRDIMMDRRRKHEIAVTLFKAVYQESKKRQLTHWYAAMTKGLNILISRLAINFDPAGDLVDYHGMRTPYLGDIKKIEQEISLKNEDLYVDFTQNSLGF